MTRSKIKVIECTADDAEAIAKTLPNWVVDLLVFTGDGLEVPSEVFDQVSDALGDSKLKKG